MRTATKMLTVLRAAAGGAVPVIATDAVIGTELDAGAGYDAYQWQSSSDGAAWADISGATAQTYTPDDAVFGLFLRVLGDSAASNATGRVAEVPEQTLGSNLIVDGDMEAADTSAWTAVNATLSKQTGTPLAGAQVLRVLRTGSAGRAAQNVLSAGTYYQSTYTSRGDGTNRLHVIDNQTIVISSPDSTTSYRTLRTIFRANSTQIGLGSSSTEGNYAEGDEFSTNALTLNGHLTAPSADMRIKLFYTLPVSPIAGDQIWLMPRISNFASGNYLLALLQYTGTQWKLTLCVVSTDTRAAASITANNVGVTNGLAVVCDGDDISLETTADGGDNWTVRGTPATIATYNTAQDVNAMWTEGITPGRLEYE